MEHLGIETDHSTIVRASAIAALALLCLASAATPVRAAFVDLNGGVLSYADDSFVSPPIANDLTVSLIGGSYKLDDPAETTITLSPNALAAGCTSFDSNTVNCPAAILTSFRIATGHGADRVDLTGVAHPAAVIGGTESDTLIGGDSDDIFQWAPGDGSDVIDGGPGDDSLDFFGSIIAETFNITPDGSGFDLTRNIATINLQAQSIETLTLRTLGGADNVFTTPLVGTAQRFIDTPDMNVNVLRIDAGGFCLTRENDLFELPGRQPIRVTDFQQVFADNAFCAADPCDGAVATLGCTVNRVHDQPCQGTDGDDLIVGTPGPDVILGGGGRDRINGKSGNDVLCGEDGDDKLVGGAGNDALRGGEGNDRLTGGADDDDLDGGAGDDRLSGGGGNDTLLGGIDADRINGGSGLDHCLDPDAPGPFPQCE
jgi:Ca2+-binding RTX toxin-like protein